MLRLSVLLAAIATASAQTTVRTVPNLPSYKTLKFPPLKDVKIPNPEIVTLSNGMKVYLLEDHELPTVAGTAIIRTGNLFDPADKRGLATVTGAVLRSGGTASKTGDQIDEQLENLAASVESSIGESSGSLSFSCLRENTDEVLGVFRDLLTTAEFRQDKLDLIKTQIRSSIARRNDDAGGIANREFQSIVYGRNTPFGWSVEYEHIDNIQRADVVGFYKRYYFPSNIILAVYGDFNTADMKSKLENLLGEWKYSQPAVPKMPVFNGKPDPGIFIADKADVTQTFFEIGHKGGIFSDKDYPALQVAADILGSGFTSRLMRKIRTELGYAYSINAGWGAGFLSPGLFDISGSTKSASTADTIQAIEKELARLRTEEVTDLELKTAKDTVENGFVFNFDTPAKTLNRIVTYDYFGYPRDFIFDYRKAITAVTRADVLRVAKQYLKPEDLTIVAVGNVKEFGRPLNTLGIPVKMLDITIPEPKKAAAKSDASTQAAGTALAAKAREAMGGADKIAAAKDMYRVANTTINTGGAELKAKQTTRAIAPATFRQDQELPFGKIVVYTDGASGWIATPQGVQTLPPPIIKQAAGQMFREFPAVLLAPNVNAVDATTLELTDAAGNSTRLVIDPASGLPSKQIYQSVQMGGPPQPVEELYSDWRDVNGLKLPFHIEIMQSGKKFSDVTVSEWKVNAGLKPEDLSKKP